MDSRLTILLWHPSCELPYFYHLPWLAPLQHRSDLSAPLCNSVMLFDSDSLYTPYPYSATACPAVQHVFNVLTRKTRKMWLSSPRHLSITQSKLYIMSVCWTNFCNFLYQLLDEHFQSFSTEKLEISELTPAFMFKLPLYKNRIWRNCISKNVLKI